MLGRLPHGLDNMDITGPQYYLYELCPIVQYLWTRVLSSSYFLRGCHDKRILCVLTVNKNVFYFRLHCESTNSLKVSYFSNNKIIRSYC